MDGHSDGSQSAGDAALKTFLVCGMTGVGKSTFINKVTGSQLSISGDIDSDTADVIEEGIPLFKVGEEYIQLVDTPGFGDSRETTESVILGRISTWLAARHMSKLPVTGFIFLRPIHELRVNQLEKALMAMFKDLCGKDCLDHIFLVTTRWTSEATEEDEVRASELASRPDFFGTDGEKKVQVRRLNDNYSPEEAQSLVKSCAGLPSVTFRIQREVVDQEKTLGQTQAGMRIGADQEERLVGLEEKAKKASEYALGAKKQLEETEHAKIRLEEERAQEAERSRREAEAAEEARRLAEAEKERSENERKEAEERVRKEEEAAEEARRAAAADNERLEKERKEAEERAREAEEKARAAEEERAREEEAAQRAAEEERARQESERNEQENIMKGAEEFGKAVEQQTQQAVDEVARFGETVGKGIESLFH